MKKRKQIYDGLDTKCWELFGPQVRYTFGSRLHLSNRIRDKIVSIMPHSLVAYGIMGLMPQIEPKKSIDI